MMGNRRKKAFTRCLEMNDAPLRSRRLHVGICSQNDSPQFSRHVGNQLLSFFRYSRDCGVMLLLATVFLHLLLSLGLTGIALKAPRDDIVVLFTLILFC